MPFDFRKAEKEYYSPLEKPQLMIIPSMRFAAICGSGKPDDSNPSYIQADSLLYEFSCFLRGFSRLPVEIADSFEYTLPPLELMYFRNEEKKTSWTLQRRIPDFFTKEDISVIRQLYEKKSGISTEKIQILNHSDGMCIQMGHCKKTGKTSAYGKMEEYALSFGVRPDVSAKRPLHEIFLPQRGKDWPKTVLRLPVS